MRVAFDARPCPALRVKEVALQPIGVVRVFRDHPSEKDVLAAFPGVLEKTLTQVHVVAADSFGNPASRTDALQKEDPRTARRHGPRHVGFRQPNGGLNSRSWREVREEGRLDFVWNRLYDAK